jgi:Mn2+/Fe2+ NRAMP family transporter
MMILPPESTEKLRPQSPASAKSAPLSELLENLGPGLITGAAADDPLGISTYSVEGASFGYATLWTALLSFPLMAAIQLMCARLGWSLGEGWPASFLRAIPDGFYGSPARW